jgi:hypothetical protein
MKLLINLSGINQISLSPKNKSAVYPYRNAQAH